MGRFNIFQKILLYIAIAVFMTFILLPFFEMFMASLGRLNIYFVLPTSSGQMTCHSRLILIFGKLSPMLGRYIFNSVFLATVTTMLCMSFVIPSAYSYARFSFKGKRISLGLFLGVNMFAGAVLLIPLYKLLRTFGFLNTYAAMFVPGAAFLVPTGIWLLKAYLEKIPIELEESAYIDGASRMYILRRVVLPLAVPGLIVVAVATFIGAYAQQFLFAITFNQKREFMPLPAGIFLIYWLSDCKMESNDGCQFSRNYSSFGNFSFFTEIFS
ncbi:MAG: ABC transporter permease [Pseudomonadota bacterium]|nr:MAG: ABC transporter permease [Pseudomonadota bacterium]